MDLKDPLYYPFERSDQYGTLGRKPQSLVEQVRLVVFGATVVPLKFLGCLICVVLVWALCRLSFLLPAASRRQAVVQGSKRMVRLCLLVLGFTSVKWVKVPDFEYTEGGAQSKHDSHAQPAVILSNHISYVDILVHLEHSFCSFVARSNTQDMPLIGPISRHLQCIMVDRDFKRKKKGAEEEAVHGVSGVVKERMEMVASGKPPKDTGPLLLFPEGTTTNGRCLLNFKTGAFLAGAPVQPVVLKYGRGRVSPAWESIDPFWHVFLMLANTHSVTCWELPVYYPNTDEAKDAKLYAANVRRAMMRFGDFESSDSNLQECRAYISLLEGKPPSVRSKAGQLLLNGAKLPPALAHNYFPKAAGSQANHSVQGTNQKDD
ncbi:hypothetical protein WJX73_006580 [Symbiochloris irregularis]|uniref:Phospholipid/glycerol acyltransferase domain-containing protein n=1 Tax=Symbiochloris irregularis TaxID=706552 RepID=A0AAW1PSF4_9CHLO